MAVVPAKEDDRGGGAAIPASDAACAVVGLHATQAKRSAVDVHGRLRLEPIHGLRYRAWSRSCATTGGSTPRRMGG